MHLWLPTALGGSFTRNLNSVISWPLVVFDHSWSVLSNFKYDVISLKCFLPGGLSPGISLFITHKG